MIYDYETPHLRWQISERADGVVELYRFMPGDNPPYGGRLEFVSDHDSSAKAESLAENTDSHEFREPDEPPEPIPLMGKLAPQAMGGAVRKPPEWPWSERAERRDRNTG